VSVEPDRLAVPCILHTAHRPANLTIELHHVIPVAWQLFWQPVTPPFPGPDTEGRGMLWDNRVVACCPTGHRNAHYYIVKIMHAVTSDDVTAAIEAARLRPSLTTGWAGQALRRFKEVGGSVKALHDAHMWGQA
jgi:hypothetical protein